MNLDQILGFTADRILENHYQFIKLPPTIFIQLNPQKVTSVRLLEFRAWSRDCVKIPHTNTVYPQLSMDAKIIQFFCDYLNKESICDRYSNGAVYIVQK